MRLWSFTRACSFQGPKLVRFCSTQEMNKIESEGAYLGTLCFITIWSPENSPWEDREIEKKVKHNLGFLKKAKWGGREENEVGKERGRSRRRKGRRSVWGRTSGESFEILQSLLAVPSRKASLWADNSDVRTLFHLSQKTQQKTLLFSSHPSALACKFPTSWIVSVGSTEPTSSRTRK